MFFSKANTAVCSLTAFLAILLTGCGGGGNNSPSSTPATINSTQINASAVTLAQSLSANIQAANVGACSSASQSNFYCDAPVAVTSLCTGSGKSTATGDITANWSAYASGPATLNLTLMPASCTVSGTSLTLTGNPSLTATGTVSYVYAAPETALVVETGTISYGTSPSGSCPVNLTLNAVYARGNTASCKVTGTMCGQTISQSC